MMERWKYQLITAILILLATLETVRTEILTVECNNKDGTPDTNTDGCKNNLLDALQVFCIKNPEICKDITVDVQDLNECDFQHGTDSGHDCNPDFATCVNTDGSFHCVCQSGYTDPFEGDTEQSGVSCADIDECKSGTAQCAPDHSRCINSIGSYTCECENGFEGNAALECTDVDECTLSSCPDGAGCTNTLGSFTCRCPNGYAYDSAANTCDNINECNDSPCVPSATCTDSEGSFTCDCPEGVTCTENPCGVPNDCSSGAACVEIPNGYTCHCLEGYTGEPRDSNCVDLNECTENLFDCHGRARCVNNEGSYVCVCQDGFTGDGQDCDDIDECVTGPVPTCVANAECVNTYGGVECQCLGGYQFGADNVTCEDINECDTVNCGQGTCDNTEGGYECVCHTGYGGEPCVDVDECLSSPCPDHSQCRDNQGSYECTCDFGYEGEGTNCSDIDECKTETVDCGASGTCVNEPGTFECNCDPGYTGIPCENINECATNPCSTHASCDDNDGSFVCTCNDGYTGNGLTCTVIDCDGIACGVNEVCDSGNGKCICDVGYSGSPCSDEDECLSGPCSENADCTNTEGSYSCRCKDGFTGEGDVSCTALTCSGEEIIVKNSCENATLLWIRIKFNNLTYTESLSDTSSTDYDNMVEKMNKIFTAVMAKNNVTLLVGRNYIFTPGSLVVTGRFGIPVQSLRDVDEFFRIFRQDIEGGAVSELAVLDPSDVELEENEQGADSLILRCPSTDTDVCAQYYDLAVGLLCQTTDLSDCFLNFEADPCLFGFRGTFGHTCNPEFSTCNANSSLASKFECECLTGFTDEDIANPGHNCSDIDECADSKAACGPINNGCSNTPGSFSCTCFSGFSGNPCEDTNECEEDPCVGSTCKNSEGSFQCACFAGYERVNPTNCADIDECAADSNICGPFGHCENTGGSYICNCNLGFHDNNVTCIDIDECDENPCDAKANCSNNIGTFTCACIEGYTGKGISGNESSCLDENECEGENGGHNCNETFAECHNVDGGFSCQCKQGYRDEDQANSGRNCTDFNECKDENGGHNCNEDFAECQNEDGKFSCKCKEGFTDEDQLNPGTNCTDLNECEGQNGGDNCNETFAECQNEDGTFSCKCKDGFSEENPDDPGRICTDQNECLGDNGGHGCNDSAECRNNEGTFSCLCKRGFRDEDPVNPGTMCADFNECDGDNEGHDCNETFAECQNEVGTFSCRCKGGFMDEDQINPGRDCRDLNECEGENDGHNCNETFADCQNEYGTFSCRCKDGFMDEDEEDPGKNCIALTTPSPFTTPEPTTDNGTNVTTPMPPPPTTPPPPPPTTEVTTPVPPPPTTPPPPPPMNETTAVPPPPPTTPPPPPPTSEEPTTIPPPPVCPPPPPISEERDFTEPPLMPPMFPPPPPLHLFEVVDDSAPMPPMFPPPPPLFMFMQDGSESAPPLPPFFPPPPPMFIFDASGQPSFGPPPPLLPPPIFPFFNADGTSRPSFPPPPALIPPPPFPVELLNNTISLPPPPPMIIPPPPMPESLCPNDTIPENCTAGYELDQVTFLCVDIDECMQDHDCLQPRICKNTEGSYECDCKDGFKNVDGECIELCGDHICLEEANCASGEFEDGISADIARCRCPDGVFGDGITWCNDFNECSNDGIANPLDVGVKWTDAGATKASCGDNCTVGFNKTMTRVAVPRCHDNARCINQYGGFMCECNDEFFGNGIICTRTSPCENITCPDTSKCVVNGLSYDCTCDHGLHLVDDKCIDFPDCASDPCPINADCVEEIGDFQCVCHNGYTGDNCDDIDECKTGEFTCKNNEECMNTDGDYDCVCVDGYRRATAEGACEDRNECVEQSSYCTGNYRCNNIPGSAECICDGDFREINDSCIQVHPCDSNPCLPGVECVVAEPDNKTVCPCPVGYFGDGITFCNDTNECNDQGICTDGASCVNTEGSYRCECIAGYRADGTDCIDKDECADRTDTCTVNQTCENTKGNFICNCNPGYYRPERDDVDCVDLDECTKDDQCTENYRCENTLGAWECVCDGQFQEIEDACVPVHPCDSNPCLPEAKCVIAGPENKTVCLCPVGYFGDGIGVCLDKNECEDEGICSDDAGCINIEGSYICQCLQGFLGDGKDCEEINECTEKTHTCTVNQTCENTRGSYNCKCITGFHRLEQEDVDCVDQDECNTEDDRCAENYRCENTLGTWECICDGDFREVEGVCEPIELCDPSINSCLELSECFVANGVAECRCPNGYSGDGIESCVDVDECLVNEKCSEFAQCNNTEGSFECTCNKGYLGNGFECQFDYCTDDPCPENANCENLQVTRSCTCKEGFIGDNCDPETPCNPDPCGQNGQCVIDGVNFVCTCDTGYSFIQDQGCQNTNECQEGNFECVPNSECHDTEGSYECICNTGFAKTDGECRDIDECAEETHECGDHATCSNNENGGYSCKCTCGYTDISDPTQLGAECNFDECLYGVHNCSHICTNSRDGFECSCDEFFELQSDGTSCEPATPCEAVCGPNGICYEGVGGPICRCDKDFTLIMNSVCIQSPLCGEDHLCEHECKISFGEEGFAENCMCRDGHVVSPWSTKCCVMEECTDTTCNGHGNCTDSGSGASCSCDDGYTGSKCEQQIDCSAVDCGPGHCQDRPTGGFFCECFPGYTGDTSCTDFNECEDDATLCSGHGQQCVNTEPGYRCECREGFRIPDDDDEPADGSVCYEETILSITVDLLIEITTSSLTTDVAYRGTFDTDVYFQNEPYDRFYIQATGAIVLERGPAKDNRPYNAPPGKLFEPLPNSNDVEHALIAAFLGDYDRRAPQSRILYTLASVNSNDQQQLDIISEVSTLVQECSCTDGTHTTFQASEILVVEWRNMVAKVTERAPITQKDDTFQLILATNGEESYVIFNYRIGSMDARHGIRTAAEPRIGFASTAGYVFTQEISDPRRPDLANNTGKMGTFGYQLGTSIQDPNSPEARCMEWYNRQPVLEASPNTCPPSFRALVMDISYRTLPYHANRYFRESGDPMGDILNDTFIDEMNDFAGENCFRTAETASDGSGAICCYDIGATWALLVDGGFNPTSRPVGQVVRYLPVDEKDQETALNFLGEDVRARETCCDDSNLCDFYKEKRPPTILENFIFIEISFTVTYAEPWLNTLDGNDFSFSGLGEYLLASSATTGLNLQGRFTQSTDVGGNPIQGTILTAFAAQIPGSVVEFKFAGEESADFFGMNITINKERINDGDKNSLQFGFLLVSTELFLQQDNTGKVTILIGGSQISVQAGSKNLVLGVGMPQDMWGTVKGLYGFFDGDLTNDFELRNGTVLDVPSLKFSLFESPSSRTEELMNEFMPEGTILEEKVFGFGQSWLTEENETIFTYEDGESWSSMRDPSFVPQYLPELFTLSTAGVIETIRGSCLIGNNTSYSLACVRTVLITNDTSLASETTQTEQELEEEEEALNNVPPNWVTEIKEIEVQVGTLFTLQIVGNDTGAITYGMRGTITNETDAAIDPTTGIFTWTPTDLISRSLFFVVTDEFAAEKTKSILVKICQCENDGTCDYDVSLAEKDSNSFQTFGCTCPAAYSGTTCEADKDECITEPCPGGTCLDAVAPETGYICNITCGVGQTFINNTCFNVDFCDGELNNCESRCESVASGVICSCELGYQLNATDGTSCNDIDECTRSNPCPVNTRCENTEGSYSCFCKDGYSGDPSVGCVDINECTAETDTCNRTTEKCDNEDGSFSCSCQSGFTGSAGDCMDINECETGDHSCTSPQETCRNTYGSRICACSAGFFDDGGTCSDIDECESTHNCPETLSECLNQVGTSTCVCMTGYTYNQSTNACDDNNECAANDGKGDCETTCTNSMGSYTCSCLDGYKLNTDSKTCSDINECHDTSKCQQNCTNEPGTFTCSCFEGFGLVDGECAPDANCSGDNSLNCVNAECFVDNAGIAKCQCNPGYEVVNSTHCQDIRECDVADKCGSNAICTELDGSFGCSCDPFYADDSGSTTSTVVSCIAIFPPRAQDLLDSNIGETFVYVMWFTNGPTESISVSITKNDTTGTPINMDFGSNVTSYNFTGLDHDTTYIISFTATYKGVGSKVASVMFTTKIAVNPPILEVIVVSDTSVTSSSIAITWSTPDIGYCDQVKVYYSEVGSDVTEAGQSSVSPVSIGGLKASTAYTFQASCMYKTSESAMSNTISQFTRPEPPTNPQQVADDTLAYGSVALELDPPTPPPHTYQYEIDPLGPTVTLSFGIPVTVTVKSIPPATATKITFYSFSNELRSTGVSITVTVPATTTTPEPTTAPDTTSIEVTTTIDTTTSSTTSAGSTSASSTTTAETTASSTISTASTTTTSTAHPDTTTPVIDTTRAVETTTTSFIDTTASSTTVTPETSTATSSTAAPTSVSSTSVTSSVPVVETSVSSTSESSTTSEISTAETSTAAPTTASSTASSTSTTVTTPPETCGFGQTNFNGVCRAFRTRTCRLRLTSILFTSDLNDSTSSAYQIVTDVFNDVFRALFGVLNIEVYEIRVTFSSGSVVGEGTILLPDTVEDDSATLTSRINDVIQANDTGVIDQYGVESATFTDFDQCTDATENDCHVYASCTNEDPGYICSCGAGYRDTNSSNPGTSCESQCQLDGESYCKNGGTCHNTTTDDPDCSCTTFFQGKRCAETNGGAVAGVVLGIVGGLLLIVLVVILVLHYKKKRQSTQRLTGEEETRKRYDEVSAGSTNGSFRFKERNLDDMLA